MSEYICSKCEKICKDKRGLAIHESKCGKTKIPICPHCNETYCSMTSLNSHIERCKVLRQQQSDKEQSDKFEALRREYEEKIKELTISREERDKQLSILSSEILNVKREKEEVITQCKQKYEEDIKYKVKSRDNNIEGLHQQVDELKDEVKNLNKINKEYLMLSHHDKNYIVELSKKLSEQKPTVYNNTTTHYSSVQHTNNVFQLQPLDPSIFQGRIKPPENVIGSANGFVNHMSRLGIGNYYRLTDMTRGNAVWHKQGVGEIKDPKCAEITNFTVDNLNDEFQKQKVYWQDRIDQLRQTNNPDPDSIRECQALVDFSDRICRKDSNLMRDIQQLYIERGKPRSDTSIDRIYELTYFKICSAISNALFPSITNWIGKTPYELGVYLSGHLEPYYIIEGISKQNKTLVIKDDNNNNHLITADKFQPFLVNTLSEFFNNLKVRDIIIHLLTSNKEIDHTRMTEWLNYIHLTSLDVTDEIFKGLIYKK